MRIGSLFAGIGGLERGVERGIADMGVEADVAWQVELSDWCRRVLAKWWPKASRYPDVISCSGASPVKTSVSRVREMASTVSAPASSGILPDSFASLNRGTWESKTSQLSLIADSTPYSGRWPRSGMMLSGTASRLPPSAPLTAATGSFWSRGEHPTPSATPYGSAQNGGQVPHKRPTKGTPSLGTWARGWPTPTSGDCKASGSRGRLGNKGNKAHEGASLTDVAVRERAWATPASFSQAGGDTLTPGMGDHWRKKRGNLMEQVSARLWPTPMARDEKGAGFDNTNLPNRVRGRHHRTTCTHGGKCRPCLNPRFVAWLMGFPQTYCEIGDER